jgi:hypothetical protein
MTVDEMQIEWAKYVGDDVTRADEILSAKRIAKEYIRNIINLSV